ncbi:MAG: M20/M25/M40 family metallo-hydrolase [Candidatus Acidiferrales bacterium]
MTRCGAAMLCCLFSFLVFVAARPAHAQLDKAAHEQALRVANLKSLEEVPAISGYEKPLGDQIISRLAAFHPEVDNIGDIVVTLGSGAPRRLLVTGIDEPGFVVSAITDDGYIRVQRLPQGGLTPMFNELYSAQPVKIGTSTGAWIDGVVAGLSVHLAPGRLNPPKSSDLDEMYIDIGASSADDVRKAGVDVLSPIAINRRLFNLGDTEFAGAAVGDRFGAAAFLELLASIDPAKIKGTLTLAFVVQQRTGARGLQRILTTMQPDEMIYVGRLFSGGPVPSTENLRRAPRKEPGSGVLAGAEEANSSLSGFAGDLKQLADANKIPFGTDYSAAVVPKSYLPAPPMPPKWAHIGVATAWADTPAELINAADFDDVVKLLEAYTQASGKSSFRLDQNLTPSSATREAKSSANGSSVTEVLQHITEAYGVSDHEERVRETIRSLLPAWATPETDDAGNLIVRIGTAPPGSKMPRLLVVAHMDEIGFEVKSIAKDGRLEVEWKGGGVQSYFSGHPALVHTGTGDRDAVVELPENWDTPKYQWPPDAGKSIRVDAGARSPEDAAKLGIRVGDSITIPKAYRPLLGTCANGRSFDDRVGDTALVSALWILGGPLKDRDVTFAFSTGEELGLVGAGALAKRLAAEGREPDYVFAVDTFVSSDSPLESKRFGDAQVGKGFVVRAVDNSNIVPHSLVEKILKIARANQIPAQFGVTGGGNDGSAFVRYGSVDVALGWPLRYSHSPAEVVDTRDVEALGRIVAAIARSW